MHLKSLAMVCGHSTGSNVEREAEALKAALSRLSGLTSLSLLGHCSGLVRGISRQMSDLSQLVLDLRRIQVSPSQMSQPNSKYHMNRGRSSTTACILKAFMPYTTNSETPLLERQTQSTSCRGLANSPAWRHLPI